MHIYYAITPAFSNVTRYVKEGDFENVYDKIFFITNDHHEAEEAAGWCEFHLIGDTYEHDLFTIEIIEDDD